MTDGLPLSASEVTPTLAGLLDAPLVLVDVGCRWGFADAWDQLGDRCTIVGFEPDAEECARLREHYRDRPWVRIVAEALGRTKEAATLHITREPACSSVYAPLDDVIDRHPRLEPQRQVQEQAIELVTLDEWCATNAVEGVDLVKLDTQGSELDVLRGAERTLASTSVVQTEVEFNPMYEGQPLFGDVDRFLRERGFVLWRLDNLSHHRQHGARVALRPAFQLYDFDTARFTHRSGQLFWADALFVRADMTRLPAGDEWPVALRRACLASALGLADLTGFALDGHARTLDGETREIVEAVRRLLPPPDDEIERLTALAGSDPRFAEPVAPEAPPELDGGLVVPIEEPLEGTGWYEPHRLDDVPVRYTGPSRHSWIDLGVRLPPGTTVELVVVSDDLGLCKRLRVSVNGVDLPVTWTADDRHRVASARVPRDYESAREFTRVEITTPEPVPRPGRDPRKLGFAVTEMRLRPPAAG